MFGLDVMEAVLARAVVGGGVPLLVMSLRGFPAGPARPDSRRDTEELLKRLSTRLAVAAVAGLLTLIVTRWVVAALGIGGLVMAWNAIAGGAGEEKQAMARLEGLASWT